MILKNLEPIDYKKIHELMDNSLCKDRLVIFRNISPSHILMLVLHIGMGIGELLLHVLKCDKSL